MWRLGRSKCLWSFGPFSWLEPSDGNWYRRMGRTSGALGYDISITSQKPSDRIGVSDVCVLLLAEANYFVVSLHDAAR